MTTSTCGTCGESNQLGTRFCGACGTTLGADSGAFDPDRTGVVGQVRPRIADFIDDDEVPLPFAFLLVVAGPARGQTLVIDALPAVVGRSADADHQILDDTVSRRHCQLFGDHDGVAIEDLDSANGTRVNGHDLAGELHLRDGDILELGSAAVLVKLVA